MSRPNDDPGEIRVLTWNVNGLDETQLGERTERLCLEILVGGDLARAAAGAALPPMPQVLALQEVVRVSHRAVLAPHLSAAGYALWPAAPLEDREHYELLAVRAPWTIERCERRPFEDSPLARAGTIATMLHGLSGERVTVITGHLESLRNGADARIAQTLEIAEWMRACAGPALFAGDTNLREGEWDAAQRQLAARGETLRDAFIELGSPAAAKVTWRPENDRRAGFRFDRVWLGGAIEARSMRLRRSPRNSDHAGVEVVVARTWRGSSGASR